jgi:hypothetical protein
VAQDGLVARLVVVVGVGVPAVLLLVELVEILVVQ